MHEKSRAGVLYELLRVWGAIVAAVLYGASPVGFIAFRGMLCGLKKD